MNGVFGNGRTRPEKLPTERAYQTRGLGAFSIWDATLTLGSKPCPPLKANIAAFRNDIRGLNERKNSPSSLILHDSTLVVIIVHRLHSKSWKMEKARELFSEMN